MDNESCWKLISGWLETCKHHHMTCGRSWSQDWTFLPTRLLDVGVSATQPRLIITNERNSDRPSSYLALSHCWGKTKMPTLTTSNIQDLRRAISLSGLPPNFRDAIQATRKLGFRYLWIDSLCIIQDSIEDWAAESVTMGKVYQTATLCIAAAASKDADGGLFQCRSLYRCRFNLGSRTHSESYLAVDSELWTVGVGEAPLNTRAWVLQERFFAPRTVYFGSDQVYWECREMHACEVFPISFPPKFRGTGKGSFKNWRSKLETALASEKRAMEHSIDYDPQLDASRHWKILSRNTPDAT
jgi:hypothetical protein